MFSKVFEQILDSSIAEDYLTRFVFEDFLLLGWPDGVVDMTHEAFARRTNVPIEIVRASISKLEMPDPRSRSPREQGRRLILLDDHRDWGWQIVNYQAYRDMRNEEHRRDYMRDYMRNRRNPGKQDGDPVNSCKQPLAKLAQLEVEEELDEKEKIKDPAASSPEHSADPVFTLPLKDGSEYGLPKALYEAYVETYKAIDVKEQLVLMRAWLLSNPGRQKKRAGIKAFINGWLRRERDKPDSAIGKRSARPNDSWMGGGSQKWSAEDCQQFRAEKAERGETIPEVFDSFMRGIEQRVTA